MKKLLLPLLSLLLLSGCSNNRVESDLLSQFSKYDAYEINKINCSSDNYDEAYEFTIYSGTKVWKGIMYYEDGEPKIYWKLEQLS